MEKVILYKNVTKKNLLGYSYSKRRALVTYFLAVCDTLGVEADNLYKIEDVSSPTIEDLSYILYISKTFENIAEYYGLEDGIDNWAETYPFIHSWFRRPISQVPFNDNSPLYYMQRGSNNILETYLYSSNLLTDLNHLEDYIKRNSDD